VILRSIGIEYHRKFPCAMFFWSSNGVTINGSLNAAFFYFLLINFNFRILLAYENPSSSISTRVLLSDHASSFEKHARILYRSCTFFGRARPRVYRSTLLRDSRTPEIIIHDHERLENAFAPGVIFLSEQQFSLTSPEK